VFIGKLVNDKRITAIAGPSSVTVNNNLWCECHLWPRIIAHDIDAICYSGGWPLRPAAAAVYWHVLVDCPAEKVLAINVAPIEVLWQSIDIKVFVRLW
jgi:hypothetical protein